MESKLIIDKFTKIVFSATSERIAEDKRLLIPIFQDGKIGFINKDSKIVQPIAFNEYLGECYQTDDYVVVGKYNNGETTSGTENTTNSHKLVYGLIDAEGTIVLKLEYYHIFPSSDKKKIYTVENIKYQHGVVDVNGNIIVPFGKYDWIDGFTNGFARVKKGKASSNYINNGNKWGIIDENGNEVLPVENDSIWNFYNKPQHDIKIENKGTTYSVKFSKLSNGKKQ